MIFHAIKKKKRKKTQALAILRVSGACVHLFLMPDTVFQAMLRITLGLADRGNRQLIMRTLFSILDSLLYSVEQKCVTEYCCVQ